MLLLLKSLLFAREGRGFSFFARGGWGNKLKTNPWSVFPRRRPLSLARNYTDQPHENLRGFNSILSKCSFALFGVLL